MSLPKKIVMLVKNMISKYCALGSSSGQISASGSGSIAGGGGGASGGSAGGAQVEGGGEYQVGGGGGGQIEGGGEGQIEGQIEGQGQIGGGGGAPGGATGGAEVQGESDLVAQGLLPDERCVFGGPGCEDDLKRRRAEMERKRQSRIEGTGGGASGLSFHHWTSTWRSVNGWGGSGGFSAAFGDHQSGGGGGGGTGAGQTDRQTDRPSHQYFESIFRICHSEIQIFS